MGVYINMEMPDGCVVCPFFIENHHDRGDDSLCRASGKEAKCGCPLVPVPPHGRLIDADALDSSETDYLGNHLVYLVDIDDAPTIIQAEPFNNLSKPCKDDADIPICTKAPPASLGIYKKAEEGE